jgi:hypothetical protein
MARSRNPGHDGSGYKKFAVEHGLKLGSPTSFSLLRYEKELDRLQAWCNDHLNTMVSLLTHDKKNITQKFFEEVAVQVRRAFEHANRDAEVWLRAVMAPMETQVREHQIQLKRRLESIKRIHQATDTWKTALPNWIASRRICCSRSTRWKRSSPAFRKC